MLQLFIDYVHPIITNILLWFSVWLPITNACIAIYYVQHRRAMLERGGVCELAHSFILDYKFEISIYTAVHE